MSIAVPSVTAGAAVRVAGVAAVPVRVQYGNHLRITQNSSLSLLLLLLNKQDRTVL